MESLLNFLHSIRPLTTDLKGHLMEVIQSTTIKKKGYLLKAGRISTRIYYIEKGLLRCFYLKGSDEVTSWFMKEGDIVISVDSFFQQRPGFENIQALEDCELYFINHEELQYIYDHFPEFNYIGRILTENYYKLSEERLYSIRMQKAKEKYEFMVDHYPELVERVYSKYMASYLGINQVTLCISKKK